MIVNLAFSQREGRKIVMHALQDTNALMQVVTATKLVVMVNMQQEGQHHARNALKAMPVQTRLLIT